MIRGSIELWNEERDFSISQVTTKGCHRPKDGAFSPSGNCSDTPAIHLSWDSTITPPLCKAFAFMSGERFGLQGHSSKRNQRAGDIFGSGDVSSPSTMRS